jgi:epoxyqueuosine reductase
MKPAQRSNRVRELARQCGFDAVGIASPGTIERSAYYTGWIERGQHGSMAYLARHAQLRREPAGALPGCRSVICVAVSYHRSDGDIPGDQNEVGLSEPGATGGRSLRERPGQSPAATGRVARYSQGVDYHVVLHRKLERLREALCGEFGPDAGWFKACVDTFPVIERELAARAGLGWIGKNTLVLNQRLGSYFVLGELFTTLELEPDAPQTDHCGSCTRCLEACPTQAFPAPHQMDASRCISYFTIEHRGDIPPEIAARFGDWVYGCDICQEVCPFNRKAEPGRDAELTAEVVPARLNLQMLTTLRSGEYRRLTAGSAMRRASRPMLQRNAAIVWKNLGGNPPPAAQSNSRG